MARPRSASTFRPAGESPLYSDRERAALAWTEALTLVAQTHAPDEDYEHLKAHFSEEEQVKLTLAIGAINAWNRFAIGFRSIHPSGRAVRPPDGPAADLVPGPRPRLVRLAYRMLGSMAEAEDIVQEAWLRWHGTDRAAVREPAAYLSRTVARLCLDHLKSARVRRETYIGPCCPSRSSTAIRKRARTTCPSRS